MIELERTFLAKSLPDLSNCKSKEIIDIYIPRSEGHAAIRIRKNGDKYEITKKTRVDDDPSKLKEENISITEEEFQHFNEVRGKRVHKIRYYYPHNGRTAEIDVFQGALKGLIAVEFEFDNDEEKESFQMPEFCLVDVTHSNFIAGGLLCGKSYQDIEEGLNNFGYSRIE